MVNIQMPELPEVETVKQGLAPYMDGARIEKVELRRENLRFEFPEDFCTRLEGKTIISLGRRAKYLVTDLSSNEMLIMHLGMSGSFRIEVDEESQSPGVFHHDKSKQEKHDHVILHLKAAKSNVRIIYNDPRRFGFMQLIKRDGIEDVAYFAKMGIEPVGNELNGETIARLFEGKKTILKSALLDQRLIAGLGNIYVCEALHGAGLSPTRKAGSLVRENGKPGKYCTPLADEIRDVIKRAIKAGGSSLRDHRQADGSLGYFQHSFKVYDQEGNLCPKPECSGTIARIAQSGRSTFYCPKCQK